MAQKLLVKVRVEAAEMIAPRVKRFLLAPVKRAQLPAFEAGAHIIAQLPNGLRRPYSLCSDPADLGRYEIAVLREPESLGGSAFLHEDMKAGDTLFVTHPDNTFALAPDAAHHTLIAGGIGITPLFGMARVLARQGKSFALHYCCRSADDAPYLADLRHVIGDDRFTLYAGATSRLDIADLLRDPRAGEHVYCCGPARMTAAVEAATAHWPAANVHFEKFQALDRKAARQGDPFDVLIASSGEILQVPADKSLLDVLREAGQPVDYACEAGACGSCRVGYSAGEPIHRDACLNPDARRDTMIACVSRAKSRLTLRL